MLASRLGEMASVLTSSSSSVWPSLSALATRSAPMLPPAPVLFSTTTGWPMASCSFGPIRRARMSLVPPGANGTMILTGLLKAWAWAAAGTRAKANATTPTSARRARQKSMFHSPDVLRLLGSAYCIRRPRQSPRSPPRARPPRARPCCATANAGALWVSIRQCMVRPYEQTADGAGLDRFRTDHARARGRGCTQGGRAGPQARRLAWQLLLALLRPRRLSCQDDRALESGDNRGDHRRHRAARVARGAPRCTLAPRVRAHRRAGGPHARLGGRERGGGPRRERHRSPAAGVHRADARRSRHRAGAGGDARAAPLLELPWCRIEPVQAQRRAARSGRRRAQAARIGRVARTAGRHRAPPSAPVSAQLGSEPLVAWPPLTRSGGSLIKRS